MSVPVLSVQITDAVRYAHSKNILHRDLRPSNVLLAPDGAAKVVDFSISRLLDQNPYASTRVGSPPYMAPEHFQGRATFASDVYSIGVMMYEMVTGVRPFTGPNLSNVIYQILNQDPVPPRQRNSTCPERLEKAILKALAKDPAQRFTNVREFAAELKEAMTASQPRGQVRRAETTTAMAAAISVEARGSRALPGKPKEGWPAA